MKKKKTGIVITCVILVVLLISAGIVLIRNHHRQSVYREAVAMANAGDNARAYAAFCGLGSYRDSKEQAEALLRLDPLAAVRNLRKGDYATFGRWEQDDDAQNGPEPLDWLVLDRVDDRLLLLSESCLECRAYDGEAFVPVTWEDCDLRAWLNDEFLNGAFNDDERAYIPAVKNENRDHSQLGTEGGNDTEDRVFLLSETDTVIYLSDDIDREAIGKSEASAHAVAQGIQTDEEGHASWWLRSPGTYEYIAQFVDQQGQPYPNGANVDIDYLFGVRPAIWLDVSGEVAS